MPRGKKKLKKIHPRRVKYFIRGPFTPTASQYLTGTTDQVTKYCNPTFARDSQRATAAARPRVIVATRVEEKESGDTL